ncbi:MAG: hypothetical protein ACRDH8_10270 [Actinomycetota bacterium]
MTNRKTWIRGGITLAVVALLAGALITSPVGAAKKGVTKKKAKKISKNQVRKVGDPRFINVAEKAADSELLDGLDSADISKVDGKRRDWYTAGQIFGIGTTPVKVLQIDPSAAGTGQFLINYHAWWFSQSGTTSEPLVWVELDQATDCDGSGPVTAPPGRIPGSVLGTEIDSTYVRDTLGGAVTVPVNAGAHKVVLCARTREGTGGISDASVSALFARGGATMVITAPGLTRRDGGIAGE